jgi:hypothetical protein
MTTIYVLKLKNDKWYVGKTTNPASRIESHFKSNGCYWTRRFPPIQIQEQFIGDDYDEDKYVLKYMHLYGIDNVRGGAYSQLKLSEESINSINARLIGVSDTCFKCGKKGHFIGNCKPYCERCGRNSHTADKCYAKSRLDGSIIKADEVLVKEESPVLPVLDNNIGIIKCNRVNEDIVECCINCGSTKHESVNCHISQRDAPTKYITTSMNNIEIRPLVRCSYCGDVSHNMDKCPVKLLTDFIVGLFDC